MTSKIKFTISHDRHCYALLAACLSIYIMAPSIFAAETQFMAVSGNVSVTYNGQSHNGQSLPPKSGERVTGAFTLNTDHQAYTQLRFDDGTLLTVLNSSMIQVAADESLILQHGGLDLMPGHDYRSIVSADVTLKTNGFVKLRLCAEGCKESPGLYGKPLSGEVIIEYAGGRSIFRDQPFYVSSASQQPITLTHEPEIFLDKLQLERAAQAKAALAEQLKAGMELFKASQYEQARAVLQAVVEQSPIEYIVSYYLGLIALELKDNETALKHLKQYARNDPSGAQERGVNQLLTLLLANQLQDEVKTALHQESTLSQNPPEPNSIAVQPFTNRSNPIYTALAKGIAAMIITDLSKVPGLKVLERQKVQKLIDEIRLSQSGLVAEESMIRAGRLMHAEKVIVGNFEVQ